MAIKRLLALLLVQMLAAPQLFAGDVTIPNTFSNGTTAIAADVNENFDELATMVNRDDRFYAVEYDSVLSDTDGIVEAYAACVSAGGGTIIVPNQTTTIDGTDLAGTGDLVTFDDDEICHFEGYGSPGIIDEADPMGGSIIKITNSVGITAFNIQKSGVRISHLAVLFEDADATTTGIYCGEVNNTLIEDVNMQSDGAVGTGAGIGIDMDNCLKSTVRDTETAQFAIGLRVDGYSNATGVYSSKFRSGGLGMNFTGSIAEAEEFTLLDVTVENNERGLLIDGSSSVLLIILDSHFEQVTGTLANRYNIRVTSTGGPFLKMVGGSLGPSGGVPTDRDYYRTSSASLAFGPDHLTGLNIHNGVECSGSCLSVDVSGSRKVTSAAGNVFTWTNLYSSSDECEAALVGYVGTVYGMTCAEPDGDVWQCQDLDHASGTDDNDCDHVDEVTKIIGTNAVALGAGTTGNYVDNVTGDSEIVVTHTPAEGSEPALAIAASMTRDAELAAYTTGTSTPTDGSTACATGDMHLETDRRVSFFCVDGAADDWWGIQLLDDVP